MVREQSAWGGSKMSRMSAALSETQQVRIVDNTRLSSLTNKIMELVLDNIRLTHMNVKLVDYCKRQTSQSAALESMEQHTATAQEQSSEDLTAMREEADELRAKVSTESLLFDSDLG